MLSKLDRKVPGGKLLRVEVEHEGGRVVRARVGGDFFAHPEELFEEAESALAGLPVERLGEAARDLFARPGLVVFGAGAEDIAAALEDSVRGH